MPAQVYDIGTGIETVQDALRLRIIETGKQVSGNEFNGFAGLIDKYYEFGTPAEGFYSQCPGAGKTVQNPCTLNFGAHNVEKCFPYPVTGWAYKIPFRR